MMNLLYLHAGFTSILLLLSLVYFPRFAFELQPYTIDLSPASQPTHPACHQRRRGQTFCETVTLVPSLMTAITQRGFPASGQEQGFLAGPGNLLGSTVSHTALAGDI